MMRAIAVSVLAVVSAACSASTGPDADDPAPILEVTSPARGTLAADATSVTVTGRVTDNGKVRVTVSGVDATVAADGSFTATVPVGSGVALLETHAIDSAGHDVRDVRAVLAGTLAPSDGSTTGSVGARAGVTTLRAIGDAIASQANTIDFNAAAMAMNPVYDNGGCLGAKINITNITLGSISAGLAPTTGLLSTDVTIPDLSVKMSASFKVACIGGSTTITIRASKAKIHGDLGLTAASGSLVASLPGASVSFEGFSLDIGGVPGAIESLLRDQARGAVEKLLTNQIKAQVPPIANRALAGLVARPVNTSLLGHDTTITIAPTTVSITPTELFVGLSTGVRVAGGEGGTFVTTPSELSAATMGDAQGLGIALDDDIVNQLFAGMWAADALDQDLSLDAIPALGALLDDDARSLVLHLSLPPTVSTDTGALALAVGDMLVSVRDQAGTEIQQMAISLSTTLAATPSPSGNIVLSVGTPTLFAQVLTSSAVVDDPMSDDQIEGVLKGAWGLVGVQLDDALGNIPMPTIGGVQLGAPSVQATTGYVLADIPVM